MLHFTRNICSSKVVWVMNFSLKNLTCLLENTIMFFKDIFLRKQMGKLFFQIPDVLWLVVPHFPILYFWRKKYVWSIVFLFEFAFHHIKLMFILFRFVYVLTISTYSMTASALHILLLGHAVIFLNLWWILII